MKNVLITIAIALSTASVPAQAATIYDIQSDVSVYANGITGVIGDYYDQNFTGLANPPINQQTLKDNVTGSDLTSYAWSPEGNMPSGDGGAYIDLRFSQDLYNHEGNDLVLFFAGTGTVFKDPRPAEAFLFSADVGIDGSLEADNMVVITSDTSDIYGDQFYASYAFIDLGDSIDGITPFRDIRVFMDDTSMPALAAVGAYHTTAVPLPLPALLFLSGLSVFGFFTRRRPR
jgi:hypothetical protein